MQSSIPDLRRLTKIEPLKQAAVSLGIALVSLVTAPQSMPGGDTTILFFAALLSAVALMATMGSDDEESANTQLNWKFVAFGSATIAVALSIVVSPFSGLILAATLAIAIWLTNVQTLAARFALLALIPHWIWVAASCWRWQLLVLLPLLLLASLAVAQLQDAEAWPEGTERIMRARAHRYAGWLLIALAGVLLMAVGLLGGVHKPYLALAGVILAVAIPLEAGFGSTDNDSVSRASNRIVITVFVVASVSWLIGIE